MSDRTAALLEFSRTTWGKVLAVLTVLAMLLGVATQGVALYGQFQISTVKAEIARNADERQNAETDIAEQKVRIEQQTAENATVLEKARAAKAIADAAAAKALADNARIRQAAEKKFAAQRAITEAATAKYAARIKRAEADKLASDAFSAQEVAKNAEAKYRAEADKETLKALTTEHAANITQWLNNCAADRRGPGRLADCSIKWGCVADPSGILC